MFHFCILISKVEQKFYFLEDFRMKKIVSFLLASALFGASSLVAVEPTSNGVNKLQASESEFLFGKQESNNVAILSDKEMKETKGEFFSGLGGALVVLAIDKYGQKKGWW